MTDASLAENATPMTRQAHQSQIEFSVAGINADCFPPGRRARIWALICVNQFLLQSDKIINYVLPGAHHGQRYPSQSRVR